MAPPANWPTTLTQLANRIMTLIGEIQQFTNIDTDTSDNALLVRNTLYDTIRDTQAAFPWPELEAYVTIEDPDPTFTDTTGFTWQYRYSLPDDFLRPQNEGLFKYRNIGAYVYTNVSENLQYHYGKYDEDVTIWSGALYRAVLYRSSMGVVLPITQSEHTYQRLLAEYNNTVEPECQRIRSYSQQDPNNISSVNGTYTGLRRGWM